MKKRNLPQCVMFAAVAALTAMALATSVRAQVETSDPSLPPLFPPAYYTNHVANINYGGAVTLTNVGHQALPPVNRMTNGLDEIETFSSQLHGQGALFGNPLSVTANGNVTTVVFNKVGNVTGTFQTEMLSMNLSGGSLPPGVMIRESPTLPSQGVTSITDIGGGLYNIDSFFDVFTELSIDGGQTWTPDQNGPERVTLVPEPSVYALASLAAVLLALRRTRWFGKKN